MPKFSDLLPGILEGFGSVVTKNLEAEQEREARLQELREQAKLKIQAEKELAPVRLQNEVQKILFGEQLKALLAPEQEKRELAQFEKKEQIKTKLGRTPKEKAQEGLLGLSQLLESPPSPGGSGFTRQERELGIPQQVQEATTQRNRPVLEQMEKLFQTGIVDRPDRTGALGGMLGISPFNVSPIAFGVGETASQFGIQNANEVATGISQDMEVASVSIKDDGSMTATMKPIDPGKDLLGEHTKTLNKMDEAILRLQRMIGDMENKKFKTGPASFRFWRGSIPNFYAQHFGTEDEVNFKAANERFVNSYLTAQTGAQRGFKEMQWLATSIPNVGLDLPGNFLSKAYTTLEELQKNRDQFVGLLDGAGFNIGDLEEAAQMTLVIGEPVTIGGMIAERLQ